MADGGISEGAVDLFGLPLVPERGKGRPPHEWTLENSNVVNLLFACGRKPIEIARVLKISKPTFYKHYFNEIANAGHAPLMMRARQLARLNAAAEGGNVAAEKALAGMIQAEQVKVLSDRMSGTQAKAEPKARPLGKKEEQHNAAQGVVGKYAPPDAPQLLN